MFCGYIVYNSPWMFTRGGGVDDRSPETSHVSEQAGKRSYSSLSTGKPHPFLPLLEEDWPNNYFIRLEYELVR